MRNTTNTDFSLIAIKKTMQHTELQQYIKYRYTLAENLVSLPTNIIALEIAYDKGFK